MQGHDIVVLEPPVDLELALHVLLGVLDLAQLELVHDLDRDAPQRLRVHRLLHLALRALADQLADEVRPDELARLLVGLDDRRALARLRDGLLLDAARHGLGGGAHQSAGIAQASRRKPSARSRCWLRTASRISSEVQRATV